MNRFLAPERSSCDLGAAVRDHLVHVHVELGAASGHPHVERKHVVMLAGDDLVADPGDQLMGLGTEAAARAICVGCRFLEYRVGDNHLPRNEVGADAEVLERSLGLRAPKLVSGNSYFSKTIGLSANFGHDFSSRSFLPSGRASPPNHQDAS